MNLQNYRLEPNPLSPGDWRVFGDIYDNDGNLLGTFGPDGTSMNQWWVTQDNNFQYDYVNLFAQVMAQQIAAGTAE